MGSKRNLIKKNKSRTRKIKGGIKRQSKKPKVEKKSSQLVRQSKIRKIEYPLQLKQNIHMNNNKQIYNSRGAQRQRNKQGGDENTSFRQTRKTMANISGYHHNFTDDSEERKKIKEEAKKLKGFKRFKAAEHELRKSTNLINRKDIEINDKQRDITDSTRKRDILNEFKRRGYDEKDINEMKKYSKRDQKTPYIYYEGTKREMHRPSLPRSEVVRNIIRNKPQTKKWWWQTGGVRSEWYQVGNIFKADGHPGVHITPAWDGVHASFDSENEHMHYGQGNGQKEI